MIYLFSDSHIDDGTGLFTKTGGPAAMNSFLDMVDVQPDKPMLVGVGDILDLWAWPYDEICNGPHHDLLQRLIDRLDVYVLGNHDLQPNLLKLVFRSVRDNRVCMSMRSGPVTIIHGHQFDPNLNTSWKRWLASDGDRLIHEINNPAVNDLASWFQKGDHTNVPLIASLVETNKPYILGHSHVPIDMIKGDFRFVNTGCWCDGDPHYATIDDFGSIELRKWKG